MKPNPVFLPGKSPWTEEPGCSPWGHKELGTTSEEKKVTLCLKHLKKFVHLGVIIDMSDFHFTSFNN